MPLVSGSDFEEDPVNWAVNVRADIERLYQRVNGGSNDGNANAVAVSQLTRQQINNTFQLNQSMQLGNGSTIIISQNDLNGIFGADIRLRVVDVCVDGMPMRMLILASLPFV